MIDSLKNFWRLQQRVRGNTKWPRRRSTQSCTWTITGFKKSELDDESVEITYERIKVANKTRSEYEYFKRPRKDVARQLNFIPF